MVTFIHFFFLTLWQQVLYYFYGNKQILIHLKAGKFFTEGEVTERNIREEGYQVGLYMKISQWKIKMKVYHCVKSHHFENLPNFIVHKFLLQIWILFKIQPVAAIFHVPI